MWKLNIIILSLFSLLSGCVKTVESNINSDIYYVKYIFEVNGYETWHTCNLHYSLNHDNYTYVWFTEVSNLHYEVEAGPFQFRDTIIASIDSPLPNKSIELYISKNDSQFILKSFGQEDVKYVIDY